VSARGERAHMVGSPVMNYMGKGLSVHRGHKYGVTDVTCPTLVGQAIHASCSEAQCKHEVNAR
jgi:hypothetical protein